MLEIFRLQALVDRRAQSLKFLVNGDKKHCSQRLRLQQCIVCPAFNAPTSMPHDCCQVIRDGMLLHLFLLFGEHHAQFWLKVSTRMGEP